VKAGQEEGFVRVNVAQPGHDSLVQKHALDRGPSPLQRLLKVLRTPGRFKRLGPEGAYHLFRVLHKV